MLTAAMVLNMGLAPVFAENTAIGTPMGALGLTDCHTAHDEKCGYAESVTMDGCTHKHHNDCGYTEGTTELPCTFIPKEDTKAPPSNSKEHSHDDTCGYAPGTEGTPCTHVHGDTCGYGETTTLTSPCDHSCEVCQVLDSGKPQEKICTCEPAMGASDIGHGEGCPFYTKPSFALNRSGSVNTEADLRDVLANAVDGATILLSGSFSLTTTDLVIEKTISLDLNGKTLVCDAVNITVANSGRFTLTDGVGSGMLTGETNGIIINEGQLTITDGTVENAGVYATAIKSSGSVIMTGGTINATGPSGVGIAIMDSGSVTVSGDAKVSCDGVGIANEFDSTGTITVEGNATVTATNIQTGGYSTAISNWGTGTVNINGGKVQNTVDGSVIHNADTGTINVNGGQVISPGVKGDTTRAVAIRNSSTGTINVTGGKLMAHGDFNGYVILNDATTAGGMSGSAGAVNVSGGELVATGGDSCAIYNKAGTLTVSGKAKVHATNPGGIALANIGAATINGGIVRVGEAGDVAVVNGGTLDIFGGVVGRVELDIALGSPTTYVYGQDILPAEPTGVPIIIGDRSCRIMVTQPSAADIKDMLSKASIPGATLPSADDPLAFFELKAQTSDGVPAQLPEGTKLVMPFPLGENAESSNYNILHFKSGASAPPEVLDAAGRVSGIVCEPTSLSPFMAVKFNSYKVTFDANGGMVTPATAKTDAYGKLSLDALPAPNRSGHDFIGWFTELEGGTEVTLDMKYMQDTTIYAQWNKVIPAEGKLIAGTYYLFPGVPYTTSLGNGWKINSGVDATSYMQDIPFYVSAEGNYTISVN